jgi:glyoxylase-like metal-dependent hydrolase (beta-lactamase superfamily II)
MNRRVAYWLAGTALPRHLARLRGRMPAVSEIDGMGTERARCVLAPNPSPMTLDGTNTWILGEPGASRVVVIDPGPKDGQHLRRVADAVRESGRTVGAVLLTHGHPDHAAGAAKFADLAGGVSVRALDPRHRLGSEGLAEGDVVSLDGLEVRVLETPGHSDDSLSFWISADRAILTGDTVLGYGTTVVDGRLGDYLASLDRLRDFAGTQEADVILPGHGPKLDDPVGALDYYIDHRQQRLAQVVAAVAAGAVTAKQVVEQVYADVDKSLWPAAEWSVQAQLDYLREVGRIA